MVADLWHCVSIVGKAKTRQILIDLCFRVGGANTRQPQNTKNSIFVKWGENMKTRQIKGTNTTYPYLPNKKTRQINVVFSRIECVVFSSLPRQYKYWMCRVFMSSCFRHGNTTTRHGRNQPPYDIESHGFERTEHYNFRPYQIKKMLTDFPHLKNTKCKKRKTVSPRNKKRLSDTI